MKVYYYYYGSPLESIYHCVLLLSSIFLFLLAVYFFWQLGVLQKNWLPAWVVLLNSTAFTLSVALRRLRTLRLQHQAIRQNLRYRYQILTGQSFFRLEKELSISQMKVLRFAGNTELVPLLALTIAEKLPPSAIKNKIQLWPDNCQRVKPRNTIPFSLTGVLRKQFFHEYS